MARQNGVLQVEDVKNYTTYHLRNKVMSLLADPIPSRGDTHDQSLEGNNPDSAYQIDNIDWKKETPRDT